MFNSSVPVRKIIFFPLQCINGIGLFISMWWKPDQNHNNRKSDDFRGERHEYSGITKVKQQKTHTQKEQKENKNNKINVLG